MNKKTAKIVWFLAGFFSFYLVLIGGLYLVFWVPASVFNYLWVLTFVLLFAFGFFVRFNKKLGKIYYNVEDFVKKSHGLYYFVRGIGAAFLLIIVLFAAGVIYGALAG